MRKVIKPTISIPNMVANKLLRKFFMVGKLF
jgi:hypothetical protein